MASHLSPSIFNNPSAAHLSEVYLELVTTVTVEVEYYYTDLECNIGIFMHSKYLRFIIEWEAFHVVPIGLNSISIRSKVDTYITKSSESGHSIVITPT